MIKIFYIIFKFIFGWVFTFLWLFLSVLQLVILWDKTMILLEMEDIIDEEILSIMTFNYYE